MDMWWKLTACGWDLSIGTLPSLFQLKKFHLSIVYIKNSYHVPYSKRTKAFFFNEISFIKYLKESIVEQASLNACIDFIETTDYTLGQGIILYNNHDYWKKTLLTVADAIRVGIDIGPYHLQVDYKNFE